MLTLAIMVGWSCFSFLLGWVLCAVFTVGAGGRRQHEVVLERRHVEVAYLDDMWGRSRAKSITP